MTIVLYDARDDTYFIVDQTNYKCGGWKKSIEEALDTMINNISEKYYTMSIEEYRDNYPNYDIYYLDEEPQVYEYW
jgi:hypothetical protein